MIKTTRLAPGYYSVTDTDVAGEDASVTVLRNDSLSGPCKWIAHADWDHYCVTDPMWTKADAVEQAKYMLEDLKG